MGNPLTRKTAIITYDTLNIVRDKLSKVIPRRETNMPKQNNNKKSKC